MERNVQLLAIFVIFCLFCFLIEKTFLSVFCIIMYNIYSSSVVK